jgi:hypothetical protein
MNSKTSHSPTNALFIKLGLKFTLQFPKISLLHVSVYFNQAQYKLPDDYRRPKHVGAIFM